MDSGNFRYSTNNYQDMNKNLVNNNKKLNDILNNYNALFHTYEKQDIKKMSILENL